jgi:peptide/nickel transport system ATP-binding protein
MSEYLLEADDLVFSYNHKREARPDIMGVTLKLREQETLSLVGESGSGKTTIARAVAGLLTIRSGRITFQGENITHPIHKRSPALHRRIQFVFQNPDASLNPKRKISYILGRPLEFFFGLKGKAKTERIKELLSEVHLDKRYLNCFPRQLSGGEKQRVAIAQALAAEPKLILCDEVVSALDVSVQASILDLLQELQEKKKISYLYIVHDLAVARWISQKITVLYKGQIMEEGYTENVFSPPFHPYSENLLDSIPEPYPDPKFLDCGKEDTVSDETVNDNPNGCPFANRCNYTLKICYSELPPRLSLANSHNIYCHLSQENLPSRTIRGEQNINPPAALQGFQKTNSR